MTPEKPHPKCGFSHFQAKQMSNDLYDLISVVESNKDPRHLYSYLLSYLDVIELNLLETEQSNLDNELTLQKALRLSDSKNSVLEPEDILIWKATVKTMQAQKPILERKLLRERQLHESVCSSISLLESNFGFSQVSILADQKLMIKSALDSVVCSTKEVADGSANNQ